MGAVCRIVPVFSSTASSTDKLMKKAFSLVELIVVIGIIAVLASVLLGTFSGSSESARAARCLSNMKTLGTACQGYAMASGWYPLAGSGERMRIVSSGRKRSNVKTIYEELRGWISWNSPGQYVGEVTSPKASPGWVISSYNEDEEVRRFCLTNGVLWKYVSENHEVYRCPAHVKEAQLMNVTDPNWSYVMNAHFGWSPNPGNNPFDSEYGGQRYRDFSRADRFLLFAEMPFMSYSGVEIKTESGAGQACDCVLQYRGCEGASVTETIGFNHKVGKTVFANVVFADGHAEKLTFPKGGMSTGEQQELTRWLCKGIDVSFDGKKYQNLTKDE